ncbi:hypothetical protein FQN51_006112 [Onygenales sp. PD_10]|nr:hypothetical protein FQN51_006112 [Onygenales sp. PD_10]
MREALILLTAFTAAVLAVPGQQQPSSSNGRLQTRDPDKEYHYNETIYQLLELDHHTQLFTQFISQFDDIVELLNTTTGNYTVFVPSDPALQEFTNNTSDPEELKKVTKYHIGIGVYSQKSFLSSPTFPTLLDSEQLGSYRHRISTQAGVNGSTINFSNGITQGNFFGSNGGIHGLETILTPPVSASDTLNAAPSTFSTLEEGLAKTGLLERTAHSGATYFAPTNAAFAKLGSEINSFLFSPKGKKYLTALLKYHIAVDHILYSDAYFSPAAEEPNPKPDHVSILVRGPIFEDGAYLVQLTLYIKVDLPTLIRGGEDLSIDIANIDGTIDFTINGLVSVVVPNVPVANGVIHVLDDILIPSPPDHEPAPEAGELTLEELIARLDFYV